MKSAVKNLAQPIRWMPSLFRVVRAVFHPGREIYQHLYFYGPFTVEVSDTARFAVNHYGYHVENDLFWCGFGRGFEANAMRVWRVFSEDAGYVVDVGANTGVFSLVARAVNSHSQVVALEPVPRIFTKLLENIALNNFDIRPLQIAASDADGDAFMFDVDADHSYSASLNAEMLAGQEIIKAPVRTTKIDTLISEIGWPRVDLLKIDVEKYEPAVLRGMASRLASDKPTIIIEILNSEIGAQCAALLNGLGYRFFSIDEQAGLQEVDNLDDPGGPNFLVCRSDVWERLKDRVGAALIGD